MAYPRIPGLIAISVLILSSVPGFATPTFSSTVSLGAIPDPNARGCTNGVVYTGVLNTGVCDINLSGYGQFSAPATATATYNNPLGGVGVATLTGNVSGSLLSTLTLGSESSLDITNYTPGYWNVTTTSSFSDQIDISHLLNNHAYSYVFNFDLTGISTAASGGRAFADLFINLSGGGGCAGSCDSLFQGRYTGSSKVTAVVPFYMQSFLGSTTTMTFSLRTYADNGNVGAVNGGHLVAHSDFAHTLTLTGASVSDSSGSVAGGITGSSGFSYSNVTVPEPASVTLLSLGLIGGLAITFVRSRNHQSLTAPNSSTES